MAELVLGTAQLGLENYGIANRTGKPDDAVMAEMLDRAFAAGVRWVDTAAAYGDAEERLGKYRLPSQLRGEKCGMKVVTKLRPNLFDDPALTSSQVADVIVQEFLGSQRRLYHEIDVYLLHSARYVFNETVVTTFRQLCQESRRITSGVSCYEPAEVDAAVDAGLGAVQVPYSLIDQRCERAMARAKARGLTVFARAPFCQGLLFLEPDEIPERLAHAREAVAKAWEFFGSLDAVVDAALTFALKCPYADYVVVGAETVDQVVQDCAVAAEPSFWTWSELRDRFAAGADVVNPSLWAR